MLYARNGQLIAAKWPMKRGSNQTPAARYWVNWLKENMRLWNLGPSNMRDWYREGTRNLPAKAPDLYLQMQRGKVGILFSDSNVQLIPAIVRERVSYSLDVITNVIGGLIVRGQETWEGISPGPAGSVLTSQGPGNTPQWWYPPFSGWPFTPPSAADFITWNISHALVADAGNGLLMQTGGGSADATLQVLGQPLNPTNSTVTAAFQFMLQTNSQYPSAGIALFNIVTGQVWAIQTQQQSASPSDAYHVQTNAARWNSPSSWNSNTVGWRMGTIPSPTWIRIVHNALYRQLWQSMDGVHWTLTYSWPNNEWITPTHIGPYINADGNQIAQGLLCLSWENV